MEVDKLRQLKADFYSPAQVGSLLRWDPQYIRLMARQAPEALPFPVLVHKNRTQIPAKSFWAWWDTIC